LRAVYTIAAKAESIGNAVAGIDLGQVHVAIAYDGTSTTIDNGRYLRAKRRYQNKLKARLSGLLDVKKRASKRRRRMARSKGRQLRKMQRQVRDVLHKQTSNLVSTLHASGVQTVAIGDVRSIRQRTDLGRMAQPKNPSMARW
jgi:putative transposase